MDALGTLLHDVSAHCDLQERLTLMPPASRTRGVFFRNIENVLEQANLLPRYRALYPTRHNMILWYPTAEFLPRLAVAGALLRGPEHVHDGMELIGRRNALTFAESLLGRTMLRLLSRDPKKLLRQGIAGHRQGVSHGVWTLEIKDDRCAVMHMRDELVYIESHYAGAARGTFEAIGMTAEVEVELDDRFNGRHILRW